MKRTFVLTMLAVLVFGGVAASTAGAVPSGPLTMGVCTVKARVAVQPKFVAGSTATTFTTRITGTLRCFGGTKAGTGPDVVGGTLRAEYETNRPATCDSLDWLYENGFNAQIKWRMSRPNFAVPASTININKEQGFGIAHDPLRYLLGGSVTAGTYNGNALRLTLSTTANDTQLEAVCAKGGLRRLTVAEAESTLTDTI